MPQRLHKALSYGLTLLRIAQYPHFNFDRPQRSQRQTTHVPIFCDSWMLGKNNTGHSLGHSASHKAESATHFTSRVKHHEECLSHSESTKRNLQKIRLWRTSHISPPPHFITQNASESHITQNASESHITQNASQTDDNKQLTG